MKGQILLLEKDGITNMCFKGILEENNYEVKSYHSEKEALKAVNNGLEYHLGIVNISPGDGRILSELKNLKPLSPLISTSTAYEQNESVYKHFVKPLMTEDLEKAVNLCFRQILYLDNAIKG